MMNIGQAAKRSGVSAKTIRYYESIGLLPAAGRTSSNYRVYSNLDVQTLRFVQRARGLGFSVKEVADLLALWQDKNRASAQVRTLAHQHISAIETKIAELESIRKTLASLVACCHGDERPECPILDELAKG
jgi:Cu(I)-responsive transcriptional regulator